MKQFFLTCILLALCSATTFAQTSETSFVPRLDGAVKVRAEWNTDNGDFRMAVRNTRLGFRGQINEDMGYRLQMDLSNNGVFSILDAYVTYQWNKTSFNIGQQHYQFSSDVMRGPSNSSFANRSFIGKFITNYASPINRDFSHFEDFDMSNLGSRDVGITIWQEFTIHNIPCTAIAGIMNGAGANKADWRNSPNYIGRLIVGDTKGFQGVIGTYIGELNNAMYTDTSNLPQRFDMLMWNVEGRYTGSHLRVDAEVAVERVSYNHDIPDRMNKNTVTGSIWGSYRIDQKFKRLPYIMPLVRFDFGQGIDFHNVLSGAHDRANVERITAGVNLGLHPVSNRAELRFQYEKFFFHKRPTDFAVNALFNDKFTTELCFLF